MRLCRIVPTRLCPTVGDEVRRNARIWTDAVTTTTTGATELVTAGRESTNATAVSRVKLLVILESHRQRATAHFLSNFREIYLYSVR